MPPPRRLEHEPEAASRVDPDASRAHWDAQAAGYDAAKARRDTYYGTLKGLIDQWVPVAARSSVLDVGCGTGQILAHLSPGAGVGVDASSEMIARAARHFDDRANLSFRVHDAAEVAELGPFDTVMSADLLEHVQRWSAVVTSMVEACAPGGRIVITTPSPRWAAALWVLENLKLKMPEGPHEFVPMRAIVAQLREMGCTILEARTHAMVPMHLAGLGPACSKLAARLPVTRHCGVIQLVVAERGASPA